MSTSATATATAASAIQHSDPQLRAAISSERLRQVDGLELIASENYTSGSRHGSGRHRTHKQIRRRLPRHVATTAAAKMSMSSKIWLGIAPCQLFQRRTRQRPATRRLTSQYGRLHGACSNPAIPSSPWTSPTAAT
jgi:hypothetical protein